MPKRLFLLLLLLILELNINEKQEKKNNRQIQPQHKTNDRPTKIGEKHLGTFVAGQKSKYIDMSACVL